MLCGAGEKGPALCVLRQKGTEQVIATNGKFIYCTIKVLKTVHVILQSEAVEIFWVPLSLLLKLLEPLIQNVHGNK